MRKLITYLFLLFTSFMYAQVSSMNTLQSIDGCVYLNKKLKEIIIVDKVYSNIEQKESEIIIDDSNSILLENFSIYESEKYKFYLVSYYKTDSVGGSFSDNYKVIINKNKPVFNKEWQLLDFKDVKPNEESKLLCKKSIDNETYTEYVTQVLNLKENKKLLINRKIDSISFKLQLDCDFYVYEYNIQSDNAKMINVNSELTFLHINQGLYILEIEDGNG